MNKLPNELLLLIADEFVCSIVNESVDDIQIRKKLLPLRLSCKKLNEITLCAYVKKKQSQYWPTLSVPFNLEDVIIRCGVIFDYQVCYNAIVYNQERNLIAQQFIGHCSCDGSDWPYNLAIFDSVCDADKFLEKCKAKENPTCIERHYIEWYETRSYIECES